MPRLLVLILSLTALSGCTGLDDTDNGSKLAFDSENCRSESATELAAQGLVNGQSSRDREALFEKSYRDCMAAKGYDLSGNAPSAVAE